VRLGFAACALAALASLAAASPAPAFQNEVPLKERAAVRTGADFLELYAIHRANHGRVSCRERVSPSTRRCHLSWGRGRGSGVATITAFVSMTERRLASIRYRLVERNPDCELRGPAACTATAKGRVVFRLRNGSHLAATGRDSSGISA